MVHGGLFVAFAGVGLAAAPRRADEPIQGDALLLDVLLGFAVVLFLLQAWHLFLPVDGWAWLAILLLSAAGLWRSRGGWIGLALRRRPWPWLAIAAIFALWVATQAMGPMTAWDTNLYHFQAVEWSRRFAIVPGIGNLHGPLAFNNASFLYDALLDGGPLRGHGFHFANGFLALVLGLLGLRGLAKLAGPGRVRAENVFDALVIVPVVDEGVFGNFASYVTDLPMVALIWGGFSMAVRVVASEGLEPHVVRRHVLTATALLCAAVTVKISCAVLVAALLVVLGLEARRKLGGAFGLVAAQAVAIGAAAGLLWLGRSIVMTGYPAFPVPAFPLPLDWTVPLAHAVAEYDFIAYTERQFDWSLGSRWTEHVLAVPMRTIIPLGIGGVAVCLSLMSRGRASATRIHVLIAPCLLAAAAWLWTAPSTRYGVAIFWPLAGISLAGLIQLFPRTRGGMVALVTMLLLVSAVAHPIRLALNDPEGPRLVSRLLQTHLNRAYPGSLLHPVGPTPEVRDYQAGGGLVVNRALTSCGNAALPCTPNPAPNLHLRVPGSLQDGFRVEGDWAMESFPLPWRPEWMEERRRRQSSANVPPARAVDAREPSPR